MAFVSNTTRSRSVTCAWESYSATAQLETVLTAVWRVRGARGRESGVSFQPHARTSSCAEPCPCRSWRGCTCMWISKTTSSTPWERMESCCAAGVWTPMEQLAIWAQDTNQSALDMARRF